MSLANAILGICTQNRGRCEPNAHQATLRSLSAALDDVRFAAHYGLNSDIAPHPPRVLSLAAFGRRPLLYVAPLSLAGIRNPSQGTPATGVCRAAVAGRHPK